jgi:hypothetical protein
MLPPLHLTGRASFAAASFVFAACLPSSCLYFRERERVERVSKHNDNNNKDERKRVREKVVFFAKPHLAKLSNDYLYTDHSRSTQTLKEHKIKRKSIISTKCIYVYRARAYSNNNF